MTYLGTRPPTVDEWEKYELHHRSRMSTKPGITGMWQVSGRSDITDFEEVVRLECMWLIMQQDKPEDFVIATGVQHTVRDFTEKAFAANGITIRWEGSGIEEKGYDVATGKMLVCVNPQWFRPTDVDNLWGDPTKAKTVLGWNPQSTTYGEPTILEGYYELINLSGMICHDEDGKILPHIHLTISDMQGNSYLICNNNDFLSYHKKQYGKL